jgi:glycerophosphoryl diester phosphodiesterase
MQRTLRRSLAVLLAAGLLGVLLIGVAAVAARPAAPHPFFADTGGGPWVIAHRGGALLWPENTLHAFREAAALGVNVLEGDVHATADGALVLLHDETVDRTTDGGGPIAALDLAAVRALDAAYRWTPDGGATFPLRGRGIRIPTVDELLEAFPDARLNLEIKPDEPRLARQLCETIRRHGAAERVLFATFQSSVMAEFRRACPEVATSTSTAETQRFFVIARARLAWAYTPPARAIQVPERRGRVHVLTPGFAAAARARGMHLHAWTINDPAAMRRLLDLGVDGIVTDRPDLLLEILSRRGTSPAHVP